MSWLKKLFGKEKKSANIAKDRLLIAIATDRANNITPHMEKMRADIINVLRKYIQITDIQISKKEKDNIDLLEIDVIIKKE
ncbi:MAG: cell division topological specificity factor MinE [Epsilonproteobacteria bacterium]|nr:cell division topological specificity factor MinE [Campylobacterota bacterium]